MIHEWLSTDIVFDAVNTLIEATKNDKRPLQGRLSRCVPFLPFPKNLLTPLLHLSSFSALSHGKTSPVQEPVSRTKIKTDYEKRRR